MTRTFEELAKMDLIDFVRALDAMPFDELNKHCGEILDAIDKTDYSDYSGEEEFNSPVYVEADEDDWKGNLDLTDVDFGDDDYDPCEDPDLFRESLLNQW